MSIDGLRCSSMRVSVFLDLLPMYCAEQSVQKNVYVAFCCCTSAFCLC